jgi:hypothetical protein
MNQLAKQNHIPQHAENCWLTPLAGPFLLAITSPISQGYNFINKWTLESSWNH